MMIPEVEALLDSQPTYVDEADRSEAIHELCGHVLSRTRFDRHSLSWDAAVQVLRRVAMMGVQEMVAEFHDRFDLPNRLGRPPNSNVPEIALRRALLAEECSEALTAMCGNDTVAVAAELADVVYVAYGAAITFGIDLDAAIRAVHAANMAKVAADGTAHIRHDGKILKPDGWQPADVATAIGWQG